MFLTTFPHVAMWSFKQPSSTTDNCQRYAFITTIYSGEKIDDEIVSQRWFVNTKTHQYGISMKQVMNANDMMNSDWGLIRNCNLNIIEKSKESLVEIIKNEAKIPSYKCSGAVPYYIPLIDDSKEASLIFLYCRKVDWDQHSSIFLNWVLKHQDMFKFGSIEKNSYFQEFSLNSSNSSSFQPELVQLNQFQTICRLCIQMI